MGWLLSGPAIAWLTIVGVATLLSRLRYGYPVQLGILLVGAGVLVGAFKIVSIPLPKDVGLPTAAQVFDHEGRLIGTYSKVRRFIIDTDELPEYVADAVLAAEDHDFFSHHGFSPRAMARATWSNITSLGIEEGGSTVTQQYVKNALLQDPSRTIVRKVKEAVLAVKLEQIHPKRQILGFYLNTIYFGRGTYGIEAAARSYFDKHARDLTISEAAYLAGIIRAPEAYQADEHPRLARQRRDAVVRAMVELGSLDAARAERIQHRPLAYEEGVDERSRNVRAAYFMEWLRREHLYPRFGECLYTCGLQIHTTLDLELQDLAEQAVAKNLIDPRDPEAALVALTPNGKVRALVGGRAFNDAVAASGFNHATDPPGRAAGSALKPFTLLAALEDGMTADTVLDGASPAAISAPACNEGGRRWRASNYGGTSYPALTLDAATAASVNTVYARLIGSIGPERVARVLAKAGFERAGTPHEREIRPYCSLALGSLDVTPLEMSRAYASLASEGRLPPVRPLRFVTDQTGRCLFTASGRAGCEERGPSATAPIAQPASIATVSEILGHVVQSGTGREAALQGFEAAGKTGTSQNNTDAWFAGYTDRLVTSVWVGYGARPGSGRVLQMRHCGRSAVCRPVHGSDVTGGSLPAQIWADFMQPAMTRLTTNDPIDQPDPVPYEPPEVVAPAEEVKPQPRREEEPEPPPVPEPSPSPSKPTGLIPTLLPDSAP